MLSTKLIVVVESKESSIFANGVVGFVCHTYDKLSPVTEVSLTVTTPGAHNWVGLTVNPASGLWNTTIVSDVNILSHPVLGSPTVNLMIYVESVVCEVLFNVILFWCVLYVCTVSPFWSITSHVYPAFCVVPVVSIFTVNGWHPCSVASSKAATGSSIVHT